MYQHKIRAEVLPYYQSNDLAHQIEHADAVCNLALEINQLLDTPYDEKLVILAAYMHDTFSKPQYRDEHQQLAHDFVLRNETQYLKEFSDEERNLIAKACLEHRGSYKGAFSSRLSEVISSADRGRPNTAHELWERSVIFGMEQFGYSEEYAKEEARLHIKDKFGRNGYAKRPEIYCEYFAKELAELMDDIDAL